MKKILIVTVGESEGLEGVFDHDLSEDGQNQINEIRISDQWGKIKPRETVFIGKGGSYKETAELLDLHVLRSQATTICGGSHFNVEAIRELINILDDNSLLIIDPCFISETVSHGMFIELNVDENKELTWPLKENEDYTILFSGVPSFSVSIV